MDAEPAADADIDAAATADAIVEDLASRGSVLVAFSGGVDSSTVAALAHEALGDEAVACTAVSETLPASEYEEAVAIAAEIGIRHEVVTFSELESDAFVANDGDRCYHCRSMRLGEMYGRAADLGVDVVADGTNASDADPEAHRPGLEAVDEMDAYSPLLTHGVTKEGTRALARHLGLSVWDKPSMACLSSRIPTGERVTEEKLSRVERAERAVAERGFRQFRVRDHGDGDVARVEIARDELPDALDAEILDGLHDEVADAGFDHVALDAKGYRTGSTSSPERES